MSSYRPINSFYNEYRFLSNFYEAFVTYNGLTYRNNEAAFQAQKVLTDEERMQFTNLSAKDAKRLGKQVDLRPDWKEVKVGIMRDLVFAKFEQNPELKIQLLVTGDAELIEGNTWGDRTWGQVITYKNGQPKLSGKNILGKILMDVRDKFHNNMVHASFQYPHEQENAYDVIETMDDMVDRVFARPDPKVVPELIKSLINLPENRRNFGCYEALSLIAQHKDLTPDAMTLLAKYENFYIRQDIAKNPDLTPELQSLLAKDEDFGVRIAVANRPSLAIEAMELLAQDELASVRRDIAKRKDLTPELVVALSADPNIYVRDAIIDKDDTTEFEDLGFAVDSYDDFDEEQGE